KCSLACSPKCAFECSLVCSLACSPNAFLALLALPNLGVCSLVCSPACSELCSSESRNALALLDPLALPALLALPNPGACSPICSPECALEFSLAFSPACSPTCSPELCSSESRDLLLALLALLEFEAFIAPWLCSLAMLSFTTQYRSLLSGNHDCNRT